MLQEWVTSLLHSCLTGSGASHDQPIPWAAREPGPGWPWASHSRCPLQTHGERGCGRFPLHQGSQNPSAPPGHPSRRFKRQIANTTPSPEPIPRLCIQHTPPGRGQALPEHRCCRGAAGVWVWVWESLLGPGGFKGAPAPTPGRAAPQECARRPARNATLVSCYFGPHPPLPLPPQEPI